MPLHKIRDFDPDYRTHFDNQDVIGYDLYSGNEKVGSVDDLLVDDDGRFRYLVVNTGVWIFGKKVLLPIGLSRISHTDRRVYANGLTKEQVEHLPEYDSSQTVDYDYEERVRSAYRPMMGVAGQNPVDTPNRVDTQTPLDAGYDRNSYRYDHEPGLFNMRDQDHQSLRLYEERLVANKTRRKTGEVSVGKHVETERAHTSVPVEKERVIVERTTPTDAGTTVTPGRDAFQEGQVARMEIYEEVPDIHKETVVREEVNVRKEVDRQTVDAEEQIRHEELDVNTEGNPSVEKRPRDSR